MSQPFFSVLVPTYNQARYLGAALDSLLAQTDPDWEAIVVNDGSTDDTPEVMESYIRKDDRFRGLHKANGGTGSALNVGLREARGKWVCWLSSDDLFLPNKLEVHRKRIQQHVDCRFFFTLFKTLDDASHTLSDAALWVPIPDRKWQVLTMLKCILCYGNSICVEREAWLTVGYFDESLRYAQDYDMLLRLLARYPATFTPDRTCVARTHASQSTHAFRDACFFDCAKAGINFLNTHAFSEIVPSVDLADHRAAREAVGKALEHAAPDDSFLYALGPHLALLFRILEWAWGEEGAAIANHIQPFIQKWIKEVERRSINRPSALLWKAVAVAVRVKGVQFPYETIVPAKVAEAHYWQLEAQGDPQAKSIRRYLETFEKRELPREFALVPGKSREIVIVNQYGQPMAHVNGSFRATIEVAKQLQCHARSVLLVTLSDRGLGYYEGVPFVGARDEASLKRIMEQLSPLDALIGLSRGDIFRWTSAQRRLIYQQGPHMPLFVTAKTVNRLHAAVVSPSEDARKARIGEGLDPKLTWVVPNAYDHSVFVPGEGKRGPHSMVFAAHVAYYKGADIALQAYRIIRRRFPDASLLICGRTHSWRADRITHASVDSNQPHGFDPDWLDEKGYPDWPMIERAIPGCVYRGPVSPDELAKVFRRSSLLIMPSRYETFGLVSIEAQACGCLPVLPRQCGFPETLREGCTGCLYELNTAQALADKVTELWNLGLPTDAQRGEAEGWVRATFSWEKSGAAFLRVLESVPVDKGSLYRSRMLFYRARLGEQATEWHVKSRRLLGRAERLFWLAMQWTRPIRHAVGLRKRR